MTTAAHKLTLCVNTPTVTARLLQRHFPHLLVPKGAAFAESGAEALQRIQNEVFDVVLLDIHMPDPAGPDGLTCAQAIRQGETCSLASQPNRYAHIIAVTNDCDPLHRSLYRAALLDGLIPKPIRLNHLRQFLETISELANSSCRSGKVPLINETLGPPPLPPALSHEERVFFDPSRSVFPSEPFVQTLVDQTRRSVDMLEKSRSAGRGLKCWVHGSSNAAREGGSPLTASTAASPGTPDSTPLLSPRPSATTKREDWTSHVRPWGDNDVEHCNESVFLRSPIV